MRRVRFAVYNMGPVGEAVTNARAPKELNALVGNRSRPRRRRKGVALLECVARDLPRLDHYHPPIHDRSTPARANIGLYVLDRLRLGDREWIEHRQTWPRVLHPGEHPARATLLQEVEEWLWVVSHGPQGVQARWHHERPDLANALIDAREEWLDIVSGVARSHSGPLLIFTDPNGLGDDLARRVPGLITRGTAIEAVHGRGVKLRDVRKVPSVGGVRLLSDHHGALLGRAVKKR